MLERGIWLPPSQFEAAFLSLAHTAEDVTATVEAARGVFALAAAEK
jgi:glutamate-1-semialdehyde 2,1-aminomutase